MPSTTKPMTFLNKWNVLAAYIGAGVAIAAPLIATPWYLSLLGPEAYGLICFITTIQSLIGMIDAGLSQSLIREFATKTEYNKTEQANTENLFLACEKLYGIIALAIGAIIFLSSDWIAHYWIKTSNVSQAHHALQLTAILIAVQLPGSIYRTILLSWNAQIPLNTITSLFTILRHGLGVLLLVLSSSIHTYLIWAITSTLIENISRRKIARNILPPSSDRKSARLNDLTKIWRQTAALSTATLLSALTLQADKFILAALLPVEQLGYYTIASTIALSTLQLIYPLTSNALPKLINIRSNKLQRRQFNLHLLATILGLSCLIAIGTILFGKYAILLWLGNENTATIVTKTVETLLIGTFLNALYNIGYLNWLTDQHIISILKTNAISLILTISLSPLLITHFGTQGAAFGWITINLLGLAASLGWARNK